MSGYEISPLNEPELPDDEVDAYIFAREGEEAQLGRPMTNEEEADFHREWMLEGDKDAA